MIRDIETLRKKSETDMMDSLQAMIEEMTSCAEMLDENYISQPMPTDKKEWMKLANTYQLLLLALEQTGKVAVAIADEMTRRRSAAAQKGKEQ